MPLDPTPITANDRAELLRSSYRHPAAQAILTAALRDPLVGNTALVSSFGAESVVLLHMVATLKPDLPVLMIDTQMLFAETLDYQRGLVASLGLSNLQVIRADAGALAAGDPDGTLHRSDPDACCALRKTATLERALTGYDSWITGRKRFQTGARAALPHFEAADGRVKINPLAHWRREDLVAYIDNKNLPRHPLVAKGFASIGCAPCTTPVGAQEDPRAGRWRGQAKEECGIHFENGQLKRGAA